MNPLQPNDQIRPTILAIFGGAGDLAWRKLVPALFDLSQDRTLPDRLVIIAVDRGDFDDRKLRRRLHDGVKQFSRRSPVPAAAWNAFARRIHYLQGDFQKPKTYTALEELCARLERDWDTRAGRIYYLATPPSLFAVIPQHLAESGLPQDRDRARLVVEKPIGYNLDSANALNRTLTGGFRESQIFRIDHYLGKETVQNLLAFRFANSLFEPLWNRRYIDYVTITVAEAVGVEHRGGYYDRAGALRDMVQNHLMQLLCLVAMEPMISFEADEIRNKKVDVLHALRPISPETVHQCAVRGQYSRGWMAGNEVPGYRDEPGVSPDSPTETFAALKLFVDNWRWQDVPFYLRTGKRLARQASEVAIQFRPVPHQAFPAGATMDWQPCRLAMSIQPAEGIVLRFQAKHPGPQVRLRPVEMKFNYQDAFARRSPEAYETLLWDVMNNDPTLFMRADQVEAAWRVLQPVLEVWGVAPSVDFPNYAAGTWGPEAAQSLLAEPGHRWLLPVDLRSRPRRRPAPRPGRSGNPSP